MIEVVVAMAILSIMAAVTITSMSGSKTKAELDGAARQLAAAIREAQNYALTGKNITSTSTNRACQFSVVSTAGSGTFVLKQASMAGTTCGALANAVTYTLQNGVLFSAGAGSEVRFDVPRGEPRDNTGAELASGNIDFSFAKNGSTAHVCVYPLGRIEERGVGAGSC